MKRMACVILTLAALLMAGCRAADPEQEETTNAPARELPNWEAVYSGVDLLTGEYTFSVELPVEEALTRTLVFCAQEEQIGDDGTVCIYHVYRVDVLDEAGNVCQTLSISQAAQLSDVGAGETSYSQPDGGLIINDFNFDNAFDFALAVQTDADPLYYYWLWNQEEQAYQFGFVLQMATPYTETHTLQVSTYENGGESRSFYTVDEQGNLVPVD